MSDKEDNDDSSNEFVDRIPSLPDLDRTFSLDHGDKSVADVIPDFNSCVESESAIPMLLPKTKPKLPYLGSSMFDSPPKPSQSLGFVPLSTGGLSIRNPRDCENTEPPPRQFWNTSRQREMIAKRPKAIYPRGTPDAKVASRRRHSYNQETPSWRTSLEGSSSSYPCEVTPSINSLGDSPKGFHLENNLFIPIREGDHDFLSAKDQAIPPRPLLPRTRLETNATPLPRLKLRPRGNQTSLAIDKFFP